MKLHHLIASFLLLTVPAIALAAKPVPPDSMGLSKGSVFDTPEQKVYHDKSGKPGKNELLPRGYPGAPPQISHGIDDFLPITADNNLCITCHDLPDQWGQARKAGAATPIPQSHYTDLRNAPGKVTDQLIGARYNCNQCHVPQTNAPALVENTFSKKRTR